MIVHLTDEVRSTTIKDPEDPNYMIGEVFPYCGMATDDGVMHVFTTDPAAVGCQGCINRLCDGIFG